MAPKQRSVRALTAATAGAGGAVLATAATACCVPILAPLLVSVLGVTGSIWAARLAPYGLLILGGSGSLLAYGFWTVYRKRASAGEVCPVRRPRLVQWVLWGSAVLWAFALAATMFRILENRLG